MRTTTANPTEMKAASKREQSQARLSSAEREQAQAALKVLMNHIYELHKGVRHMVLFTCNKRYSELAIQRLLTSSMRHPNQLLWYPFRTIA